MIGGSEEEEEEESANTLTVKGFYAILEHGSLDLHLLFLSPYTIYHFNFPHTHLHFNFEAFSVFFLFFIILSLYTLDYCIFTFLLNAKMLLPFVLLFLLDT